MREQCRHAAVTSDIAQFNRIGTFDDLLFNGIVDDHQFVNAMTSFVARPKTDAAAFILVHDALREDLCALGPMLCKFAIGRL